MYHIPVIATDINSFQVSRFISLLAIDFTKDFILFSVHVEIPHTLSAQSVLQGLSNVLGTYSHDTGLVTVNLDTGFRFTELQVNVRHLEDRILVHFSHKFG